MHMFTHMRTYTRIINPSHKYIHTNHTHTYTWTYAYTHIHASLKGRAILSESSIHMTHTGGFWVFRVTQGETFVFPKGCLYFSNEILHPKMLWVLYQSISKCIRQGWIDWVKKKLGFKLTCIWFYTLALYLCGFFMAPLVLVVLIQITFSPAEGFSYLLSRMTLFSLTPFLRPPP